jgi:homoserine kinase type II
MTKENEASNTGRQRATRGKLPMDFPVTAELRAVLSHYDLGDLVDYEKNERGFVNTAYAIETLAGGQHKRYFLRKYKRGIREQELLFEHSLIEHLVQAGAPVARIHHTRAGKSFVCRSDKAAGTGPSFYTIFDYLPGEDRFSWVNPVLTQAQLAASAAVLAQLHVYGSGFTPLGRRDEPRILDLLPIIAETWSGCPTRSKGLGFDDHIREQLAFVQDSIAATMATLQEPGAHALPEMVIHCDYHPGNLKFTGDRVTGVFDFDWSKRDLRLFDVGLALWYFCTSWAASDDGSLRLDWAQTFMQAYQEALASQPGAVVISMEEARYLPTMINAGNLYVLHWTVLDYFAKDVDQTEYVAFLDHSLRFAAWYQEIKNRHGLEALIASVLSPAR